ncbi:MAG: hypothetical protein AB1726_11315 [Planctomycetota bacterium]
MFDRGSGGLSLAAAWRSLSHRLAVAGGCLAALVSLLNHVPVRTASLRGAVAYAAVLVVAKLGLFALERALALEARKETPEEETKP